MPRVPNAASLRKRLLATVVIVGSVAVIGIASYVVGEETSHLPAVNAATQPEEHTRPFSPTSFWNTPLPADAKLDPKSDIYVADFQRQFKQNFGTVSVNTSQYTPPVYVVDADTPTVRFEFNNCQDKSRPNPQFMEHVSAVPVPHDAKPSKGRDAEMVIWQPSTDTMWDLWRVKKDAGKWSACWGGKLSNASKSDGVHQHPFGTTASGLALLGGLILPEELQQGEINHVLSLGLVDVKAREFVTPANRTDGESNNPNAIPEGQRFRLNPNVNIDHLGLPPAGKVIARAMQKYGFVIRDHSDSVNFYAENVTTAAEKLGRDDYSELFNGRPGYALLNNVPWDQLQAIAPPE